VHPALSIIVFTVTSGLGFGWIFLALLLDLSDREVEVKLSGGYAFTAAVRAAVKAIPGIVDVHDA